MNNHIVKLCVAGGGKTTKIIEYINNLISQNIDIQRILLISFSNTTAQDLERKLNIKAYTLHSFCAGYGTNNNIIITNYNYLINFLKQKYTTLRYVSNTQINNWIGQYHLYYDIHDINSELSQNISQRDYRLNYELSLLITDINNNIYNQRSFLDVLKDFWNNIDNIMPIIHGQFDYILIDEAQDLSILQLKIIYKMIEDVFSYENKGFIIVGDPQQIIYNFQGAFVSNYQEFIQKIEKLCKLRGLHLAYDKYNVTYRFGGEILQHINTMYPTHISSMTIGKYTQYNANKLCNIIPIIIESMKEYEESEVLILFNRNSKLIEDIQKELNKGINIKIYLYNHMIYQHLQHIYYYLTTYGSTHTNIKFNNSIFNINPYKLKQYMFNNSDMLEFLSQNIVLYNKMDILLWQEICEIGRQYPSFISFFLCLPEHITIQDDGIRFMTVHSSKGLQAKCVIYINETFSDPNIIMINGILMKDINYNHYTKSLYHTYQKEQQEQNKNLHYVALTRAINNLVEINV